MNVELMTMPVDAAQAKLDAYRSRRHADANEEYRRCEEAYAAMAEGTPLIDLQQVFTTCPVDGKGRPKLAVARADRKQVCFLGWSSEFIFDSRAAPRWNGRNENNTQLRIRFSGDRFVRVPDGYATIPMVPADVRPKHGQLKDWFILWEVEQWSDRPIIDPPYDPYLLKHIGGTLYAVLAEWDLTEIERAVMREVLQ